MVGNNPFFREVRKEIDRQGGHYNAHLHLDRAYTLNDGYVDHGRFKVLENSHVSLQKKHWLLQSVHDGPAYDEDDLRRRLKQVTEEMIAVGTTYADTMIDVTPDRVGTFALEIAMDHAAAYKDKINIQCASYTPLGFSNSQPERWDIFEQGVAKADFIGCLPEADDLDDYPDNIGFEAHLERVLDLAKRTGKMVHVHTDQRNEPTETGTERLIEAVRKHGAPTRDDGTPMIWAVHMISPSTYDDKRWDQFVEGMLETNIGVISCPSAAVGMRQFRPVSSPTYNSIPRILELAVAGVHIRLGSDNICDICSPSTTSDLMDEVFVLSAAIRYYQPDVLATLAAGKRLSLEQVDVVKEHLRLNDAEIAKFLNKHVAV